MREEEFFGRGKWSQLPEGMRGAQALKRTLSTQLQRHIGRHVRTLRRQIQAALDRCETELKSLGTGKDTVEEMRIELVELFSASKELVIPAVYGFYKNPPRRQFFRSTADPRGTPAQNLRARATEENDKFSQRVRLHGRKFGFGSATDPNAPKTPTAPSHEAEQHQHQHQQVDDGGKQEFVRNEVQLLLRQIRGSEFPMDPKPRAVYMLFQSYAEYWPKLAQEHKDNLGVVCSEFLAEVVDFAWPARMREPLRRHFLDPCVRKLMAEAQEELERLTQDLSLEVQPYDPEYEERLRRWHEESTREGGVFSEAQEVLEKMLIYYEVRPTSRNSLEGYTDSRYANNESSSRPKASSATSSRRWRSAICCRACTRSSTRPTCWPWPRRRSRPSRPRTARRAIAAPRCGRRSAPSRRRATSAPTWPCARS